MPTSAQKVNSKFTKWPILPTELRNHALKYLYKNDIANYAPCSKICNEDAQLFDKTPYLVEIGNFGKGVRVSVQYSVPRILRQSAYYEWRFVEIGRKKHRCLLKERFAKNQTNFSYNPDIMDGNAYEEALKFAEKRLKLADKDTKIVLDLKKLPLELSHIFQRVQPLKFDIKITRHSYEELLNFLGICEVRQVALLSDCFENVKISKNFFKTSEFLRLNSFKYSGTSEIDDEQFLSSQATYLHIKSDNITDQAINKKVMDWYNSDIRNVDFYIKTGHKIQTWMIIESLPVQVLEDAEYFRCTLKHENGKHAVLKCSATTVHFRSLK